MFKFLENILNKFKKNIDVLSNEYKIDCILNRVAKEYHL